MKEYEINSACSKCGACGASSKYHLEYPCQGEFYGKKKVIGRKCHNCGYAWCELPLDSKEQP